MVVDTQLFPILVLGPSICIGLVIDYLDVTLRYVDEIELLLYMLSMVFGVVYLPNTTMYGVWKGKDNLDWQHERMKLDARSPELAVMLERDLSIVESYEELSMG